MRKPNLSDLEFPVFTAENPAPEPPQMSLKEWVIWLEEARALQSPESIQAALHAALPQGKPFEWLD